MLNVQSSEEIFTKKGSSKTFKNEAFIRRMELIDLVEKVGIRNGFTKIKKLSKHYGVSQRSLYNDFKWIKKNIKINDIREAEITLGIARNRALNEALNILSMQDLETDQKLRAIIVLNSTIKHYREELEAWGVKPKIATEQSSPLTKVIIEMPEESESLN